VSKPSLILAARPIVPSQFRDLFVTGQDSLAFLLEHPESFRYAGWNLETLDQARIIDGEFLEVNNGNRKTIRLYEDGTLLARVSADSTFLGWGQNESQFIQYPRANPVAAIEFITAFVHFYRKLLPRLASPPEAVAFHIELVNGKVNGQYLYTIPGELNSIAWTFNDNEYRLTAENPSRDIEVPSSSVLEQPNRAAYLLIERFFLFFGVPTDKIPYTGDDGGQKVVDLEKIKRLR
jgi:hypothetical protein